MAEPPREDPWKLEVEDFGRIASARVEMRPLTVFAGANNSGKSYLASLAWAIQNGGFVGIDSPVGDKSLQTWLASGTAAEGTWTKLPSELLAALRSSWLDSAYDQVPSMCQRLFDTPGIAPRRLAVGVMGFELEWYARVSAGQDGTTGSVAFSTMPVDDPDTLPPDALLGLRWIEFGTETLEDIEASAVAEYLSGLALPVGPLDARYREGDCVFLPAARTGFSLFLPTFLESSLAATLQEKTIIRRLGDVEPRLGSRLTLPQVHLMTALSTAFGGSRGPYANEADRLERECLDGTVVSSTETGPARYTFKPAGAQEALGLQVTSALVTELLPLVVALRYAKRLPLLVLEEPEAHLHPLLVRRVCRSLCRLVRAGVRVLLTTHSATLGQQLNNLLKLGTLEPGKRREQQQRFGYDEDEFLRPEDIGVHEFLFREDGRTVVERAPQTTLGFAMRTFNTALHGFADETLALNEAVDPEGLS